MKFNLDKKGGAKVIFAFSDEAKDLSLVKWANEHGFLGEVGEVVYFPNVEGESSFLVGIGNKSELNEESIKLASFNLYKELKKNKENIVSFEMEDFGLCHRKTMMAIYEGLCQGSYNFTKKSSKEEDFELEVNYTPFIRPEGKLEEGLKYIENQMNGVFFARELCNETANIMTPDFLATTVKTNLQPLGVKITVYEREEIENMGMDAFMSVAMGSDNEPRFIVMEYNGDRSTKFRTGLVGKGITYDSGGYCIKPADSMASMHSDMGGAATVIGTMMAIARSKAKVNVVGIVAACENMISGHAYKTGDIISSMAGKTIEIGNTDAEGRLTLADAVYFATSELKVDRVIDLATLTGAVLVALGEEYTGVLTNNSEFLAEVKESAKNAGEKIWELPNDKAYKKLFESKVADLKNTGGRYGGSITAGQFVGCFVDGNTPWVHMDIAGTAYLSKANGYLPERATGVHVKTLYQLLNPMGSC